VSRNIVASFLSFAGSSSTGFIVKDDEILPPASVSNQCLKKLLLLFLSGVSLYIFLNSNCQGIISLLNL
jgi:hypothetical protein